MQHDTYVAGNWSCELLHVYNIRQNTRNYRLGAPSARRISLSHNNARTENDAELNRQTPRQPQSWL